MATLAEFFRLCDLATTSRCAISGDSARRFESLADQLAETPVLLRESPRNPTVDDEVLFGLTLNALYGSRGWSRFSTTLLRLEELAAEERLEGGTGAPGFGLGDPEESELVPGTFEGLYGVMCSDSSNPRSPLVWPLAARIAKRHFGYFGPIWTWFSSACADWPGSKKSRYAGPFNRWTANPVLVTSNLFDPATRYEGALTVANLLPNSHLLTVEGWGHTTLFLSSCAAEIASEYLVEGVLPDEDSTCRQRTPPSDYQQPTRSEMRR